MYHALSAIFILYYIFLKNILLNQKIYYINKNTILLIKWFDRAGGSIG